MDTDSPPPDRRERVTRIAIRIGAVILIIWLYVEVGLAVWAIRRACGLLFRQPARSPAEQSGQQEKPRG
jgi:hypothetical protein